MCGFVEKGKAKISVVELRMSDSTEGSCAWRGL